jgi:hypothetical protein
MATQTIPPLRDSGHSRLMATIITLVVLALVLAGIFAYLENSQTNLPVVLTPAAKAEMVQRMQSVIQLQADIPAAQKTSLIEAMKAKLQAGK